ncbi:MAG TPA: tRNA pseudouridine(55) synthase TruB [Bacillota bacterium]|nr:tRNA pseudouridine(55) synthase TruB [Bacillota bacterium]
MDGILPLWKQRGMTSHDCVMRLRRILHTKKVGHTGTLDPEVEGVLPICVGEATKIVPYLTDTTKTYIATVRLGIETDTEDSHGHITNQEIVQQTPSQQALENVLGSFEGDVYQKPPMYSAVKVNGKKLYEYAREKKNVERPLRKIHIYEISYISGKAVHPNSFTIKVVCGKGTYIRTLCVDIGKKLGYYAHMSYLERIQTGVFKKSESITLQQVENAAKENKQASLLFPISSGVSHLDVLEVDDVTCKRVLHGQKLQKPNRIFTTDPFRIMHGDRLIAIYQTHPDNHHLIKPARVFNTN